MRLVGLDIGTSSVKAVVLDSKGEVVATSTASYGIEQPKVGWFEQDPNQWWDAAQKCLHKVQAQKSDAIGLTGQMHGSVFLDTKNEVIRPALLWNDSRTQNECTEIESLVGKDRIIEITCNSVVPSLQLPKILWLKNLEEFNFEKLSKVLLPKDYIAYQMTGNWATDPHDASGTGCLDQDLRNWSSEILEQVGISEQLLPPVIEFGQAVGSWNGVPVYLAGGDQCANGIGTGIVETGTVGVSLGSSGVSFSLLGSPAYYSAGTLNCYCYLGGGYHAMAVTQNCGMAISASCNQFFGGISAPELSALAGRASDIPDLFFAPLFGGERCPVLCPNPSAVFSNSIENVGPPELAYLVLEGVSFLLGSAQNQLSQICPKPVQMRVSGGGSLSQLWVQMMADLMQLPVSQLSVNDASAVGAAMIAGLGLGSISGQKEAGNLVQVNQTFAPETNARLQERFSKWQKWIDSAPFLGENSS